MDDTDPIVARADASILPNVPGYELLEVLGRGGMGVVYKARHAALKRLVALKMIRDPTLSESQERIRFRIEAESIARLQHPNIVQVHEIGEHDGNPYFALEFVEGGNLSEYLRGIPQAGSVAAKIVEILARAVDAAHRQGIIHRDLKPANVLLHWLGGEAAAPFSADRCMLKITDFGLAKDISQGADLSRSGAIVGTPSYMAPEQAWGASKVRPIGPATDTYALGAILYELLTGRPPFLGESIVDTLQQVVSQEPVPPARLQPKVPRDLETICLKCLQKESKERYKNAEALADDLRRFQEGRPIDARRSGVVEKTWKWCKRRPAVSGLMAALLLFLCVGTIAMLLMQQRERENRHRLQAEALVKRLLSADIAQVPQIVREINPYRDLCDPQLRQVRSATEEKGDATGQLHASLALLPVDGDQSEYLLSRLLSARPEQFGAIRDALRGHAKKLVDRLWSIAQDPAALTETKLRALAGLADYDPNSEYWNGVRSFAVEQLVNVSPVHLAQWMSAFQPVKERLVPILRRVFTDPARRESEKLSAAGVLADYASDRPDVLADLLVVADERQFDELFQSFRQHGETAVNHLEAELCKEPVPQWNDAATGDEWKSVSRVLTQKIESAYGIVADRFAFCQTMPIEAFVAVASELRPCGYRPVRVRPYAVGDLVNTAAIWQRDTLDWRFAHGLSAAGVRKLDEQRKQEGYAATDVGIYRDGDDVRYTALWEKAKADTTRYVVDQTLWQVEAKDAIFAKQGYRRVSCARTVAKDGSARYAAVWRKVSDAKVVPAASYFGADADHKPRNSPEALRVDIHISEAVAPGTCVFRVHGQLRKTDPLDTFSHTKNSRHKVHTVELKAGNIYAIDLRGEFDTFLRVEDANKKPLLYNDDLHVPHQFDSRLVFAPAETGKYRLIATSYKGNATGAFDLAVTKAQQTGQDLIIEGKLAKTDEKLNGKLFKDYPVDLTAGTPVVFEMESKDFDTYLMLIDVKKTNEGSNLRVIARNDDKAPGLTHISRLDMTPSLNAPFRIVATSFKGDETGSFTIRVRRYRCVDVVDAACSSGPIYSSLWIAVAGFESKELLARSPAEHLREARRLIDEGHRPVALAAIQPSTGTFVGASVWHRPVVTQDAKERVARRRANAAVALLRMQRAESVWPLLKHTDDPTTRSFLIDRLRPLKADASVLVERFVQENDVSSKRAILLALGNYEATSSKSMVDKLIPELLRIYRTHDDPGLHAASQWLLKCCNQDQRLKQIDAELVKDAYESNRGWHVTNQGHTLVTIKGPIEFVMGSPLGEEGRENGAEGSEEVRHRRRIPRTFAIASKEVTVEQFLRFRTDHPYHWPHLPSKQCPVVPVNWYQAAAYCNWLSEQEKIPRDQWCYLPNDDDEYAQGMKPAKDYLMRTGYRLPTEAEWEYACRADSVTARFFAHSIEGENEVAFTQCGDVTCATRGFDYGSGGKATRSRSRKNGVGPVFVPHTSHLMVAFLARRINDVEAVGGLGRYIHLGFLTACRAKDQLKKHHFWQLVKLVRKGFGLHVTPFDLG